MNINEVIDLKHKHEQALNSLIVEIRQDIKAKTGLEPIISIDNLDIGTFDEPNKILNQAVIAIPI